MPASHRPLLMAFYVWTLLPRFNGTVFIAVRIKLIAAEYCQAVHAETIARYNVHCLKSTEYRRDFHR
jgi:hypothetical protein